MAISRSQPLLLFLLFLSLFFLPAALCGKRFQTCDTGHHYSVDVKTVEISPDPVKRSTNGNITITGYTSIEIPDGATVNLGLSIPMLPISKKTYSLCDIVACPVAPGPIVLTLTNVFTKKELLSRVYYVTVSIKVEPQEEPIMCVLFACSIRPRTSLLKQVTE